MEKIKAVLSSILQSILLSILLTIGVCYLLGYRAYLVNGWSSEPEIKYQSLIINYKQSQESLYKEFVEARDIDYENNVFHVREDTKNIYITFSSDGKTFTTHAIVAMKPEGEYFEEGDIITFDNMGITFIRTIEKRCQIVTMTNNESSYSSFIEEIKTKQDGVSTLNSGPLFEQKDYSENYGRVLYSNEKVGQILIFLRNNFIQIAVYVIIMYIAYEIFKFVPAYIKNY